MSDFSVNYDFSGAQVLVTGGTSGIGAAIASGFNEAGASVAITGTRTSAEDYENLPAGCEYYQLNLTDDEQIDRFADNFESLDVLINNAGGNVVPEDFGTAIQLNLTSVHRISQALHRALAAGDDWASIINMGSMMSFKGRQHSPGYSAAKTGILSLTQSQAAMWVGDGIRVNAIAPGAVRTPMTAGWADDETYGPATAGMAVMNRWGQPDDMVGPVMFLCSSGAAFVTGSCLKVCGGFQISD